VKSQSSPLTAGFTLIEVLVAAAIIALLIVILVPSLHHARSQTRRTMCMTNLRQIGAASWAYATAHRDKLPDADTLGLHAFRRAPGEVDPRDRGAIPETYGLAAILHTTRNLPGRSPVWICPAQSKQMQQYRNTYAFSISAYLTTKTLFQISRNDTQRQVPWVYDNYSWQPGLTGFKGPFSGYTIIAKQRYYPHLTTGGSLLTTRKEGATCALYLDGRVGVRRVSE
jgi:prepilin-type N-terminal cleavage/methylation domain-containing protein